MEERIDIHIQSLRPVERDWEYDGDGNRIYKVEAGYGTKTLYKDEYLILKDSRTRMGTSKKRGTS